MNAKTIRVQGKGSVSQPPDRIRLVFTLKGKHSDFAQAVDKCNIGIDSLRESARDCGIEPGDLKSSHFDVREETEYESGKRILLGFVATHQLGIVLPIDKVLLGQFLSSVIRSDAKPQVNLAFEVSDPEGLKQKVLASAVENAKRRADTIAMASGIKLGPIAHIEYGYTEVRISSQPCEMDLETAAQMSASSPDFEPDDVQADDTVTMTWEIASHDK